MDVGNAELLRAINTLTSKVEMYHGDFREFRGAQIAKNDAADLGRKELSDSVKTDRMWMKIQAVCVVPVLGGLHQAAQWLHWIK
jgi:hypothetical protein